MKLKIKFLGLLLVFTQFAFGQYSFPVAPLSSQSKVSLLFVEEGQEQLFQVFGHVCIMVKDDSTGIERVFSYGAFDFDTENFYWKFITGQLPYRMAETNLSNTLLEYGPNYENRSLTETVLNLNLAQKQKIYDLLNENIKLENSTYQYKFFHDNCSTRIRDILEKALGSSLNWNETKMDKMYTYRELMNEKLYQKNGIGFLMNIAIGAPADEVCDARKAMYLPQFLQKKVAEATLNEKPLIQTDNILFKSNRDYSGLEKSFKNQLFLDSILFFLASLSSCILYFLQSKPINVTTIKVFNFLDKLMVLIMIVFAAIFIFLWFFTSHGVTTNNYHLLVPVFFFGTRWFLKQSFVINFMENYKNFGISYVGVILFISVIFKVIIFSLNLSKNVFENYFIIALIFMMFFYLLLLNQANKQGVTNKIDI